MQKVIYSLSHPITKEIRYIGFTSYSIERRLWEHIHESKNRTSSHKHRWILKLLRENLKPEIAIVEIVNSKNWQERERFWIDKYKERLTNSVAGGEGLINPSEDVRRRISEKVSIGLKGNNRRSGISHSDESKLAISNGVKSSTAFRLAMDDKKGIAPMHATNAAAAKKKGVPHSEAHRLAHKAAHNTPEVLAKHKARMLGKKFITDGVISKVVSIGPDFKMPEGWKFGRHI